MKRTRLGRIPGSMVGNLDVNFVLTNPAGNVVGTIKRCEEVPKHWEYNIPFLSSSFVGDGRTLEDAHEKAETDYAKIQVMN